MSKFFDEKKEEEQAQEPELVKLGDQEYKPEELEAMVGVASKVKQFEEKAGTDFDGLTSSWGKRGEEIGKLKKDLEEATKEPEPEPEPTPEGELSPQEVKAQAQKLGLMTQDEFDTKLDEKLTLREQGQNILKSCSKMEKKIDGKDGRPAFKTDEVLEYMKETGVKQPNLAYKLKYEPELDSWKEEQLSGKKPSGLVTEQGSDAGGKEPPKVKTNYDNLDDHVKEALYSK